MYARKMDPKLNVFMILCVKFPKLSILTGPNKPSLSYSNVLITFLQIRILPVENSETVVLMTKKVSWLSYQWMITRFDDKLESNSFREIRFCVLSCLAEHSGAYYFSNNVNFLPIRSRCIKLNNYITVLHKKS